MLKQAIRCIIAAIFFAVPYELFVDNQVFMVIMNMARGVFVIAVLYLIMIAIYTTIRKKADVKYVPEIVTIAIVLIMSVAGKLLVMMTEKDGSGNYRFVIPADPWQTVSNLYYSIYQAVGGLSFEGLAAYEQYDFWRTMIFSGSSVLAGAVALSILTFSFSYEIYSVFAWSGLFNKNCTKVYIFTTITEDSVMLAHSIDEHNRNKSFAETFEEEKSKKARFAFFRALRRVISDKNKYVIIFLRTEDKEGFDNKNPLHLDIMHSGFLFRSYSPGKKNRSITRFLKIKVKNDGCLDKDPSDEYKKRLGEGKLAEVHIFALGWEKDKTSENDKIVFEDISRITEEVFGKGLSLRQRGKRFFKEGLKLSHDENGKFLYKINDYNRVIHYYFLLSEEIDMANVDMRFDNEISKFAEGGSRELKNADVDYAARMGSMAKREMCRKDKDKDENYSKYKKHFVLNALNEANMAAFSYIRKRGRLITEYPDVYEEDIKSPEYSSIVIGFGQNGQQTLKAAYIFAAAGEHGVRLGDTDNKPLQPDADKVEKGEYRWLEALRRTDLADYTPQPFLADVYDKNAGDVGGLFKMRHPAITVDLPQTVSAKYIYADIPVRVSLHQESAYSNNILSLIDRKDGKAEQTAQDKRKTGKSEEGSKSDNAEVAAADACDAVKAVKVSGKTADNGKSLRDYNLIIIALGDDDRNVSIANAFLEDCKHEYKLSKKEVKRKNQVIAVNLRNKLNYDRINWCDRDKSDFPYIKVVRFGSAEEMYSYENIVDMTHAKTWNYGYKSVADSDRMLSMLSAKINETLTNSSHEKTGVIFREFAAREGDKATMENYWYDMDKSMFYNRYSSRYACEMPPYMAAYARAKGFVGEKGLRDILFSDVIKMGAVEHDRWMRFLVANGYEICDSGKDNHFKLHSCIREYRLLYTQTYDIVNIINALKVEYDRECGDKGVNPVYGE